MSDFERLIADTLDMADKLYDVAASRVPPPNIPLRVTVRSTDCVACAEKAARRDKTDL